MGDLPPRYNAVGVAIPAPIIVGKTGVSTDTQLFNFGAFIRRVSVRNTSSSALATVQFYDGASTAGQLLDTITLYDNESTRDQYDAGEYPVRTGLFLHIVAGSVDFVVVADTARTHGA